MAKYTVEYLLTHDLDWFCYINDRLVHGASNGGTLPTKVNNQEQNSINQKIVYNQKPIYSIDDIEINTKYINKRFLDSEHLYTVWELEQKKYNYLKTFIDMAMRGFYSFDRIEHYIYNSNKYIPVAWPKFFDPEKMIKLKDVDFHHRYIDFSKLNTNRPISFKNLI